MKLKNKYIILYQNNPIFFCSIYNYKLVAGPGLVEDSAACSTCSSLNKDQILDDYRDEIYHVAKALHGEYIDMRSIYQDHTFCYSLVSSGLCCGGCRPSNSSEQMSRLLADALAQGIIKWLKTLPNQLFYFGKLSPRSRGWRWLRLKPQSQCDGCQSVTVSRLAHLTLQKLTEMKSSRLEQSFSHAAVNGLVVVFVHSSVQLVTLPLFEF
jgi:hypothetical protein